MRVHCRFVLSEHFLCVHYSLGIRAFGAINLNFLSHVSNFMYSFPHIKGKSAIMLNPLIYKPKYYFEQIYCIDTDYKPIRIRDIRFRNLLRKAGFSRELEL